MSNHAPDRLVVIQQNCQRGEVCFYSTLETGIEKEADIVLLQEQPVFSGYSHPGYELYGGKRVMMAIRKGIAIKAVPRPDLGAEADGDVLVMDLISTKGRLRLVNIYDQRVFENGQQITLRPARKVCWEKVIEGSCILAGDFNAQGPRWSGNGGVKDNRYWEDIMDEHDLIYAGDGGPTRGQNTIDLVFATGHDLACGMTYCIIEEEEHATSSDHAMISWSTRFQDWNDRQEMETASKMGGWKISTLCDQISLSRSQNQVHPAEVEWVKEYSNLPEVDILGNSDDLNQAATALTKAISRFLDRYAPRAKISPRSKRWWNDDIREQRKKLGRAVNQHNRRGGEERWNTVVKERAYLKKIIRKSKKECWEKWLQSADGDHVWDVLRGTKRKTRMDAIGTLHGEHGMTASTNDEKRALLTMISFPSQNRAPENGIEINEQSTEIWDVGSDAISKALYAMPNRKAPGPDGITAEMLKLLQSITPGFLDNVMKLAVRLGCHPEEWRKARGVVIPKPGKADYSKAKAHRTISLLNVIGKILEKLMADCLTERLELGHWLHDGQFGGRRRRGAIDAVARLITSAESSWSKGKMAGALFMDVKGAFPTTNAAVLTKLLQKYGMPSNVTRWVESFMGTRTVHIELNGEMGSPLTYESGLPQGSPASPILFNALMADLGTYVDDMIDKNTLCLSFLDDIGWIVEGNTVEEIATILERCGRLSIEWGKRRGVIFEEDKSETLLLTRKRQFQPQQAIVKVGDVGIPLQKTKLSVRWLGVLLDSELRLNNHHEAWITKARKRQAQIRRLCHNQGLPAYSAANLQRAIVQSVATYGIELYGVQQKSTITNSKINDLQKIVNSQARAAIGAFRTAPQGFLMAEGAMKPALAIYERRTLGFLARQLARPIYLEGNYLHQELIFRQFCAEGLGIERRRRINGMIEKVKPTNQEQSRGTFKILEKSEAKKYASHQREDNELRFFTDGSRQEVRGFLGRPENGAGAGVVWEANASDVKHPWAEVSDRKDWWWEGRAYHVGIQKEAFDGEIFAICMALKRAVKMQNKDIKFVRIYSDSRVALEKVRHDDDGPGQAIGRAIRIWEKELRAEISLEYCWVPAHEGVPGNEYADHFAKKGAQKDPKKKYKDWVYETSLARVNRLVSERTSQVTREEIVKMLSDHKAYQLKRKLGMRAAFKPANDKIPPSKKLIAIFLQMACGHALTGAYLQRFKVRNSGGCWWCKKPTKQTRSHLFGKCSAFKWEFKDLINKCNLIRKDKKLKVRMRWKPYHFFQDEGLEEAVIEYLRNTGIGYRIEEECRAQSEE